MLLTIAKIALAVGTVTGLIALDREWDLPRFGEAPDEPHGDVPNLGRDVLAHFHGQPNITGAQQDHG